jgi:hypothetical protein
MRICDDNIKMDTKGIRLEYVHREVQDRDQ